jgi:hypothetical protein
VLPLLIAQGGSSTRLCDTIAGGPIELHVLQQRVQRSARSTGSRSAICNCTFRARPRAVDRGDHLLRSQPPAVLCGDQRAGFMADCQGTETGALAAKIV